MWINQDQMFATEEPSKDEKLVAIFDYLACGISNGDIDVRGFKKEDKKLFMEDHANDSGIFGSIDVTELTVSFSEEQ